jgi:hypothetical protein
MDGGMFLVIVLITIILFLVCREFFCWYWKINQNLALLTEIRDFLEFQTQNSIGPSKNAAGATTEEKTPIVYQPGKRAIPWI